MKKKFKVHAEMVSDCYLIVEAENEAEALQIAADTDGGEFISDESFGSGDWRINRADEITEPEARKPEGIIIYSSHGEITINEAGEVLTNDNCKTSGEDCDGCIDKIKKFDVDEWKKYHNETELPKDGIDILDIGCWLIDGRYDEPAHDWREERKQAREDKLPAAEPETFPNGFDSWHETHFEVVDFLVNEREKVNTEGSKYPSNIFSETLQTYGTYGFYSLAVELTNEFETINKGRQWDGEFFDEVFNFLTAKKGSL